MSEAKGVHCQHCGSSRSVVRKTTPETGYIRRRRVCEDCGGRFTTFEKPGGEDISTPRVLDATRQFLETLGFPTDPPSTPAGDR